MDGFLKALGFESKPEYKDKIPDKLAPELFKVHNTFKHGFSSLPLCLGYDSVQQLLAIGTETGSVLLLGKPGLERHIQHPSKVAVTHLEFIANRGQLVTGCDNNTLYLWDLREKEPVILHSMEFISEKPTALSHVFDSEWLYVGTAAGNVHIVNLFTFKISGFAIHWNNAVELSCRHKPGDVISVQEHPLDQGKILIAFSGGKCVLYDMKVRDSSNLAMSQKDFRGDGHKRFNYDPGSDHILTCVSWLGNGKNFACSYSDGTIVLWNPKSEVKPEKIFPLHDVDPTAFKPIYKMQQVNTEGEPWIVASGGYPEGNDLSPRTLTIIRGKNPPRMLSSENTILDFLCLPSSPYASDCQKPFALVMLTKNELILHDLEQPDFPRYPNYLFPYALDIHLPGVTFLHYTAHCPDEFVASLHSVKSKLMKTSAKPWPLKGGKWGQEVPHSSTDLIVTGHVDGSVRLWYCSSVILQPFFTMSTSQYFEMQYQPSPSQTPTTSPVMRLINKKSRPVTSPPSLKTTPTTTPSPTKTTPINKTVPPDRPPPPKGTPPEHPPPPKVTTQHSSPVRKVDTTELVAETPTVDKKDEEVKVPYPATGEQQSISPSDMTDGMTTLDKGLRPHIGDNSKPFSNERKSIFKRKSKRGKSMETSPHSSRGPSPVPNENGADSSKSSDDKHAKKSPMFLKKSFRKVAKAVKIGRSISRDKEKLSVDQVDGELSSSEASGVPTEKCNKEEEDVQALKRPDVLSLHAERLSPSREDTTPAQHVLSPQDTPATTTTEHSKPLSMKVTTPGAANAVKQSSIGAPPSNKPPPLKATTPVGTAANAIKPSPVSSPSVHTDDFLPIGNVDLCVVGLWMCVSNKGGMVLAFNFQMTEQDQQPQNIDINFDSDSVLRQYKPTFSRSPPPNSPEVGHFTFTHKTVDQKPGYQLTQVCTCFYHVHPKKAQKSDPKVRVPAKISVLKYSVDLGLLVIGTNRGLALVDTGTNTCLYVLSTLTSILYLSDPSKFTRQMRKESENQLQSHKPLVKRHSTHRALSAAVTPTAKRPPITRLSSPAVVMQGLPDDPLEDDCFDDKEMTVSELESSVTAVELVQLQLDKQVSPTLTLWVGLVCGQLVAYGVNITKKDGSRKIDLIPTKFIQENKSPIVQVYFLNSWGDCQLIPFQPRRTNLTGSPQAECPKAKHSNGASEHFAVVVSEEKIRSYGFPGCVKIETCSLDMPDGSAILRSEYFKCDDLPCLLSVASNKSIFIHSLPGLKQLLHIPFNALSDTRSICTFHVSGHGQGIFMTSDSEFQRLSVLKEDKLNLPACLPSLYVKMADPEPYHGGMGKRILDALFTSGVATIDREHLFGSSARRPVGNLYKLDGKVASSYGGKRDRQREEQRVKGGGAEGTSRGKAGGLSGQLNRNVQALNERKEKLSAIEERTEAVAQHASDFAEMAKKLRQKYEH